MDKGKTELNLDRLPRVNKTFSATKNLIYLAMCLLLVEIII